MKKYTIFGWLPVICMAVGVLLFGCSDSQSSSNANAKTWLQQFMESELDSLIKKNSPGTKMTMITDGNGDSNDNGQGMETQKFDQLDYRAEMDGILEYAQQNIEDTAKFEKWVDSSINRQGLWMRITHYTAKDTVAGLQSVDIYELETKESGWTVYPPLSALGDSVSATSGSRKYLCYLVTWDFKQRSWWMDRDVRAYYQKGAQAFGYRIRENSLWGSPKSVDIQINLNNELWLNND